MTITFTEAAQIASRYGITDEDEIRENMEQANLYHGSIEPNFDGDTKRFWAVDSATGRRTAARLFEGYMAQISHERYADDQEATCFEYDAYGPD
jgi:hypothetical protein